MAYNTEELKQEAIEKANAHKCVWIEELVGFLPCDKSTFYSHFPTESNDYKKIVGILEKNRIALKNQQRKKWFDSENATLQIAHYKLIASDEERKRLTSSYTELGGKLDSEVTHEVPEEIKHAIKQAFRKAITEPRSEDTTGDS